MRASLTTSSAARRRYRGALLRQHHQELKHHRQLAPSSRLVLFGLVVLGCCSTVPTTADNSTTTNSTAGTTKDVHIAYLTDCSNYSDWQSVGMQFAFNMSGQKGAITRIMCCTDDEKTRYNEGLLHMMPTHVAPSFAYNKALNDWYAAYNKPGAVVDWLAHVTPKEEYILVIDSDMLLLQPFNPATYNVTGRGWVISADYTYLVGVVNDLWKKHIPEVGPRNDTLAGPMGRHADQVGGFFLVHREDLAKYAPLWLSMTADVRNDSDAWRLSGDQYVEKGGRPWISEMYGYVYSAAKKDIWHRWCRTTMHYPTYLPVGVPKLMHYGLLFEIDSLDALYKFDKHWHYDFDVTKCAPWDLSTDTRKGGIFKPPPHPDRLKSKGNKQPTLHYYRDLLAVETVATLNAAFCDYHLRHCPPSQQMFDVCTEAIKLYMDTIKAIEEVEPEFQCCNKHTDCDAWKKAGQCVSNVEYMMDQCAKACGTCHMQSEQAVREKPTDALSLLAKLKADLAGSGSRAAKHVVKDFDSATDPDSSKAQPLPHTDGSTVPVHSPSPSLPPPPPPPSPVQRHGGGMTSNSSLVASTKTKKDLLIRCYRMTLTSKEVKDCAAAATRGEEWSKARALTDDGGSAQAAADQGSSKDVRELQEAEVHEPTTVREHLGKAAQQYDGRNVGLMGLGTGQAVALWAVVLLLLLVGSLRLLRRLRRRQRSGMRSE